MPLTNELATYTVDIERVRTTVYLQAGDISVPVFSLPTSSLYRSDMIGRIFKDGYTELKSGHEGISTYKFTIRGQIRDSILESLK